MTLLEAFNTIVLAVLTYTTAPQDIQQHLRQQVQPWALARIAAVEYSSWILTTAAHEYGHATMAKHLTGKDAIIHLGAKAVDHNKKPLFSFGSLRIDSLNPKYGTTEYSLINHKLLLKKLRNYIVYWITKENLSKEQALKLLTNNILTDLASQTILSKDDQHKILLVGGFCGFVTECIMQAITNGNVQPNYLMIHELLNSLLPLGVGSDAYLIWQDRFALNEKQLDKIILLATILDISACMLCTIVDKRNAPHAPLHTKAMLGLINYYLSGYAYFYAGSKVM